MGKKGASKKAPDRTSGHQLPATLREEATGKKQINVKSLLKLEHMKNLALWATSEASIPSGLGAFYGHRLATAAEALGTPPDPSLFTCQSCESVLQPGNNCTIRIEKNIKKPRHRRKKATTSPQNNVVYKCHFCSHRNLMRGTAKGHMKEIRLQKAKLPPKPKQKPKSEPENAPVQEEPACSNAGNVDNGASASIVNDDPVTSSPKTPLLTLLEMRKRKRNKSAGKKATESAGASADTDGGKTIGTTSRKRRKSRTSLKEIAESNEKEKRNINLAIPFFM